MVLRASPEVSRSHSLLAGCEGCFSAASPASAAQPGAAGGRQGELAIHTWRVSVPLTRVSPLSEPTQSSWLCAGRQATPRQHISPAAAVRWQAHIRGLHHGKRRCGASSQSVLDCEAHCCDAVAPASPRPSQLSYREEQAQLLVCAGAVLFPARARRPCSAARVPLSGFAGRCSGACGNSSLPHEGGSGAWHLACGGGHWVCLRWGAELAGAARDSCRLHRTRTT